MCDRGFDGRIRVWVFWAILVLGAASMAAVSFRDAEWTRFFIAHEVEWFSDWMCDSIFEGEMLGGGDFSVFLMIFAGIVYVAAYLGALYSRGRLCKPAFLRRLVDRNSAKFARLERWYPQAAFVLFAGLFSSVYLVQSLKWTTGRARPKVVIEKGIEFSEWYEFGPHFVGEGSFRGSFPSGHTATACVLMALGYVLLLEWKGRGARVIGLLVWVLAAVFSLSMLLSRSMNSAHWISDSTFSFFVSWLIIHVTYFWLLDIPRRRECFIEHGHYPEAPVFFEPLLALSILLGFAGLAATGIGARAIMLGDFRLVILAPAGLAMIAASIVLTRKLLQKSKAALG
ncbi:MAG: phosphatase PAP2 family protein [Victivallales bacterium]|nr:phosphatase PAP2 family protein [Victivallales bacterium]